MDTKRKQENERYEEDKVLSKNRRFVPIIAALALIIVVIFLMLCGSILQRYMPSKEKSDLAAYYGLGSEEDMAIVLDDVLLDAKGIYIDGEPYIDYTTVHDALNERFYWDGNENVLLYTTPDDLITVNVSENRYFVTKAENPTNYTIVRVDADTAYIALDFVEQYTNMAYRYFETPNRVVITSATGDEQTTAMKKACELREKGGIKSSILKEVEKGESLAVLEEGDTWSKVASTDGLIGYVKTKFLGEKTEVSASTVTNGYSEQFTHITKDSAINMGWHQVTNAAANGAVATVLGSTKGVNVISPTWFYLNDSEGNIASLASTDYVSYCHQNGVEVWGLFSNLENSDADSTEVLTHTSKRQNLVNQIIAQAIQYDLDGVNLDFEALSGQVGDGFIQFVRELSLKCANNGLVLSIDNYVPTASSSFYNRAEQAKFADYIVIMGYDEHYAGSEAGSVASLGYVTEGVANTISEGVPAEQVILGMPFYTRVWALTPKDTAGDDVEAASDDYVAYDTTSQALGMDDVQSLLATNGATASWSDETSQNYAEYVNAGVTYKVWIEDAASLEKKLEVVKGNNLAGAAFWKLGLENAGVWDTIIKYVN